MCRYGVHDDYNVTKLAVKPVYVNNLSALLDDSGEISWCLKVSLIFLKCLEFSGNLLNCHTILYSYTLNILKFSVNITNLQDLLTSWAWRLIMTWGWERSGITRYQYFPYLPHYPSFSNPPCHSIPYPPCVILPPNISDFTLPLASN